MSKQFGFDNISRGRYSHGMRSANSRAKLFGCRSTMRGISRTEYSHGMVKNRQIGLDIITDCYAGMYFANCPIYMLNDEPDYEYLDKFYISKPLLSISVDFRDPDNLR